MDPGLRPEKKRVSYLYASGEESSGKRNDVSRSRGKGKTILMARLSDKRKKRRIHRG